MRQFVRFMSAVLGSALALGCTDQSAFTEPTGGATPSFANASGGAVVTRFSSPAAIVIIDFELGLTALFGATFEQLPAICADIGNLSDVVEVQDVLRPTGALHRVIKDKEQGAIVWNVLPAPGRISCEFQDVPPLAVGTVHSITADNEANGIGPGANAANYRAEGTLTSPASGEHYHIVAGFQVVVLPDGTFKLPVEDFIRLTLIGR